MFSRTRVGWGVNLGALAFALLLLSGTWSSSTAARISWASGISGSAYGILLSDSPKSPWISIDSGAAPSLGRGPASRVLGILDPSRRMSQSLTPAGLKLGSGISRVRLLNDDPKGGPGPSIPEPLGALAFAAGLVVVGWRLRR